MTGVLDSIAVKPGTLTIRRVGVDVDDVLLEKMKQRGREQKADADAKDAVVVSLASKAEIYVKFRTSPSVANNVTHPLEDLRPMIGSPVTGKPASLQRVGVRDELCGLAGAAAKKPLKP
jgi:hypothetical protein